MMYPSFSRGQNRREEKPAEEPQVWSQQPRGWAERSAGQNAIQRCQQMFVFTLV